VATEDNTEIDVHYADGIHLEDEHITLNKYEIFHKDSNFVEGNQKIDFTGSRVLATKPVSVYAGNGKVYLYVQVSDVT